MAQKVTLKEIRRVAFHGPRESAKPDKEEETSAVEDESLRENMFEI